jgi:hypothetical protein
MNIYEWNITGHCKELKKCRPSGYEDLGQPRRIREDSF